jgi:hypothetical protein
MKKETAVEWLIEEWVKLEKSYYSGAIGRLDLIEKRAELQNKAEEMFEKQIHKAWSDGYYKYSGAGDSEAYLDMIFNK